MYPPRAAGRTGEPDQLAGAPLCLTSDDKSFIAGIELLVDGGTAQIRAPCATALVDTSTWQAPRTLHCRQPMAY